MVPISHFTILSTRPGRLLLLSTILVAVATLAIPFLGVFCDLFEFVALSAGQIAILLGIVAGYVLATEAAKFWLFRRQLATIGVKGKREVA